MKIKKFFLYICVLFLTSTSLQAHNIKNLFRLDLSNTFKLNLVTDTTTIVSGLALNIGAKFIKNNDSLNSSMIFNKNDIKFGFDKMLMQPYSKPLDKLGDIFQYSTILLPSILMCRDFEDWLPIGIMYGEVLLWTYGFKELLKPLVSRPRPFMYFDNPPKEFIDDGDWARSFPSAHSAASFASATFLSYTFSKYYPTSPWKIPVVTASYAFAITTAALRIASGNHFFTDAVSGALIGSFCGFFIPYIHTANIFKSKNNKKATTLEFLPMGNGLYCKLSY